MLRLRWPCPVPGALPVSEVGDAMIGRGFGLMHDRDGSVVELRPGAGQRAKEMVRAFVAMGCEFSEALVDDGEPALDLRHHPLRCLFLLCDAVSHSLER